MWIERLVSGGQTGADRGALDAALASGVPAGGWCPKGRCAEDGLIPDRYPLEETPTGRYDQRTEWNVRDSDATLIISFGPLTGGSALTERLARRYGRPCLHLPLETLGEPAAARALTDWLARETPRVLNVAGPRESKAPGIGAAVQRLLEHVFTT